MRNSQILHESRLGFAEAAKFVGVCRSTIERWAYEGCKSKVSEQPCELDYFFLGRAPVTSEEALTRFFRKYNDIDPAPTVKT